MTTQTTTISSKIRSFTDLDAWKEGHRLVLMVYDVTERYYPRKEDYALTSQSRRAVVSITSNTAEGFSRRTAADQRHFYTMSLGSLTELQNQLIVARDIGYLPKAEFDRLAQQTITASKLLNGLIKSSYRR